MPYLRLLYSIATARIVAAVTLADQLVAGYQQTSAYVLDRTPFGTLHCGLGTFWLICGTNRQ
jgi:hypothetical protein